MAKYELTKSVEAQKLNKRTGIPLTEPPTTIPYGAILDDVREDGDHFRFTYLTNLYQVRKDVVRGALQPIDQPATAGEGAAVNAEERSSAPAAAAKPALIFEPLHVKGAAALSRARIPGGWLVAGGGGALAFVPDAFHEWNGASID